MDVCHVLLGNIEIHMIEPIPDAAAAVTGDGKGALAYLQCHIVPKTAGGRTEKYGWVIGVSVENFNDLCGFFAGECSGYIRVFINKEQCHILVGSYPCFGTGVKG